MPSLLRFLSVSGVTVAATCILAMMLLTMGDILGRRLFGQPIVGVYELVQLMLTGAVFGGLAMASRQQAHVTVDLIDGMAPRLASRVLRPLAGLSIVLTLAGLLWAGFLQARDGYRFGDMTMDLRISVLWFWTPILVGLLVGLVVAIVEFRQKEEVAK